MLKSCNLRRYSIVTESFLFPAQNIVRVLQFRNIIQFRMFIDLLMVIYVIVPAPGSVDTELLLIDLWEY